MCPHHGGSTDTGSRRPSLRHRLPTWTPGGPHFIRKHESGWGHVQGRAHAELWSRGGGRVQGLRQSWMRGSLLTIPGRDVETPRPAPGLKGQTLTLPKGPKGTFCLQEPYVGGGGGRKQGQQRQPLAEGESHRCAGILPDFTPNLPRSGAEGPSPCLHTTSRGHTHVTGWNLCAEGEGGQPMAHRRPQPPGCQGTPAVPSVLPAPGALTRQAWPQHCH